MILVQRTGQDSKRWEKWMVNDKKKQITMTVTLFGILPAGHWAGLDFWSLEIVCNLVLVICDLFSRLIIVRRLNCILETGSKYLLNLLLLLGLQMLRHHNHIDQEGFQKRPPDSYFINLFQVSDRVPAIVAGGDNKFGACGQDLVPFDF